VFGSFRMRPSWREQLRYYDSDHHTFWKNFCFWYIRGICFVKSRETTTRPLYCGSSSSVVHQLIGIMPFNSDQDDVSWIFKVV
jgi:hypothetical protein